MECAIPTGKKFARQSRAARVQPGRQRPRTGRPWSARSEQLLIDLLEDALALGVSDRTLLRSSDSIIVVGSDVAAAFDGVFRDATVHRSDAAEVAH
jgi:hypothetical protein